MSTTGSKSPRLSRRLLEEPALVARIKICTLQHDLYRGSQLHAVIREKGLLRNAFIGSSLVHLYAKCGDLFTAKQVFDELPERDVVTWTALISGYTRYGHDKQALELYQAMRCEGVSPTASTFTCIVNACGCIRAVKEGQETHSDILKMGYQDNNEVLTTALVDMYAKCGAFESAQQLFNELHTRDPVVWTALITGYTQHGHYEKAMECYKRMHVEGSSPNTYTFSTVLHACSMSGSNQHGAEIHSIIVQEQYLKSDAVLGSALMELYLKCNALEKAQRVFDEIPARNVVTWTGLIAGYGSHGYGEEALYCFDQMKREGILPNSMTFASALKACASIGAVAKGKTLHAEMVKIGVLSNDTVLENSLIDMYAKCGVLSKAEDIFKEIQVPNTVSYNALISGYHQHGLNRKAIACFRTLQAKGLQADCVTLLCILQACATMNALEVGREIHAVIVRENLLVKSRPLGNALVFMYAKSSLIAEALQVFDELPERDSISWNGLIAGFCQHGHVQEAFDCFSKMQSEGFSPIPSTLARILKVCGNMRATKKGEQIQSELSRKGWLEKDRVLGTALIDMYGRCGELSKAREIFDLLPYKDVVTWTALISAYCLYGHFEESLCCFNSMQCEGIASDVITLTCIMQACGNLGTTQLGEEAYIKVVKEGLLKEDDIIYSAVIDMYAKCGALKDAEEIFIKLHHRDVVAWTSLISGYAQLGEINFVFSLFRKMIDEGVQPSSITLMVILNASSCKGAVSDSEDYIKGMYTVYNIVPSLEHQCCMISLFARDAHFNKALDMIMKGPLLDHLPAWLTLLDACRKLDQINIGMLAFSNAIRLNEKGELASVKKSNLVSGAELLNRFTMQKEIQDLITALHNIFTVEMEAQGTCSKFFSCTFKSFNANDAKNHLDIRKV
ncbi:hypothetical protein KP509_22G064700 [Ceratopteris richardii]|uniref:Pentatricopeptide repeat-containing protein n=1 Tax=Ceratopteris richardii TaxID=49495 RepID=A0A8T2S7V5_CERRI|nr:hypothetical protein KP509_22G064700 [Ceratopteris richardii]